MKRCTLILVTLTALACGAPSFAQRGAHAGGGPPPGRGPDASSPASTAHGNGATTTNDMARSSPTEVLSHNTTIAGKIKALTGQDATTACNGFKNLGQCVAAAHVAKNLDIPGGFDALKAKMTGTGAVKLGKAIQELAPDADAKGEMKRANQQATDDLKESSS